jgi:hypothetical protein
LNNNSLVQTFGNVNWQPAPLLPQDKRKLIKELSLPSYESFFCDDRVVPWQGTELLSHLVNLGRSCLVIGEKGSGMGSAVGWLDGEPDLFDFVSLVPENLQNMYHQLWWAMGSPVAGIKGACAVCPRRQYCQHWKPYSPGRPYQPGFVWGDKVPKIDVFDARDYINWDVTCLFPKSYLAKALGIGDVISLGERMVALTEQLLTERGKALALSSGVPEKQLLTTEGNIHRIVVANDEIAEKYGRSLPEKIILRVPFISKRTEISELNELFRAILKNGRCLILLVDKEQAGWFAEFRDLHSIPWPRPDAEALVAMLSAKMEAAEVSYLPFGKETLNTLALLGDYRPGPFFGLISDALLVNEGLVRSSDVLQMLKLNDEKVIRLTLGGLESGRWFDIAGFADLIYELFNRDVNPIKIGRYLHRYQQQLALEFRGGQTRQFRKV